MYIQDWVPASGRDTLTIPHPCTYCMSSEGCH